MAKWFDRNFLRKAKEFAGQNTVRSLTVGVMCGIFLFAIEFLMAFILQLFLLQIGVIRPEVSQIPHWLMAHATLWSTLTLIILIGSLRSLLLWLQTYLNNSTFEVQRDFQRRRLIKWAFHSESISGGQFLTLFNDSSQGVGLYFTQIQMVFILFPIVLLLAGGLFYIAPLTTFIAVAFLGFAGFGFRKLNNIITKMADDFCAELGVINNRIIANIRNLILLQIYGTQKEEEKLIDNSLDKVLVVNMRYQRLFGLKYVVPQMTGVILICVITATSMKLKLMSPGLMLSYFYLFIRFAQNFSEMVKFGGTSTFYLPQARMMYNWWLNSQDVVKNILEKPQTKEMVQISGPIGWSLTDVSFTYPGATKPTLKNFNLIMDPGRFLTVTGSSGVGKSTLLHLLLGILSPTSGEIKVLTQGKQQQYELENIKNYVGYVGPETFLREGSILENLTYGLKYTPLEAEFLDVLTRSECQFIFDLPNGLNHYISEQGHGLSAGQKQRLGLARALLRRPSILVLDEATSNLDAKTEVNLVQSLERLKGSLTIVAVTHRGALVSAADTTLELLAE